MTQIDLFKNKIELKAFESVLGSGYEKDVAKLAIEDGIAMRAARKNMQIHSAIILLIDDGFAGHTLQTRFDHIPLRAVDHHRHPGDVRFGGDQFEEGRHGVMGVEQTFVHVDVNHLRAILHLLACHFDGSCIIAGHDQFLEGGRAGDIGAFTDIDEGRGKIGHCAS